MKRRLLFVSIIVILALPYLPLPTSEASPETTLKVVPMSQTVFTPPLPTNIFYVNVTVENVTDLYSWRIQIYFDTTVLETNGTWVTFYLDSVFAENFTRDPWEFVELNLTEGYIACGDTLIGNVPGVSGSGVLCQIGFRGKNFGTSYLNFSRPLSVDTFLCNSNLEDISFNVEDASVTILAKEPVVQAVPSSLTVFTPPLPTEIFYVNITVEDVTDLYTWQVRIYFNTTILRTNETWVLFPSDCIFPGNLSCSLVQVNLVEGYVECGASLLGIVPGVDGSGMLCQIGFQAIGLGTSYLNFSRPLGVETFLFDSNLNDIPFSVEDGSITVKAGESFNVVWIKTLDDYWVWENYTVYVFSENTSLINGYFNYSLKQISLEIEVSGLGFCNVSIPKSLLYGAFKLYVNGTLTPCIVLWTSTDVKWNETKGYTYVYFTVSEGYYNVKIVGEHLTTFTGDINHDGKLNMRDIGMASKNFGLTAP